MSSESASSTASGPAGEATGTAVPVGRFAPSPSGPLHFGSLLSALASYLDIRSKQGVWLLRIDDIDTHRSVGGSEQAILESLTAHGMQWDEPISWQSKHTQGYEKALATLAERSQLFFCDCSRRSLKNHPVYPGSCRDKLVTTERLSNYLAENGERSHAIRIRVPNNSVSVTDELQNPDATANQSASGDYVVFRRDGLVSYQLAVVVDDILTGVPQDNNSSTCG